MAVLRGHFVLRSFVMGIGFSQRWAYLALGVSQRERYPFRMPERTPETVDPYTYFDNRHERSDIYKFCAGLAKYLKENDVANIAFIDSAARPAWIGVDEYWNRHFKGTAKPGFYFLNPDGFNPQFVRTPELQRDPLLRMVMKNNNVAIIGGDKRSEEAITQDIADRFDEVFVRLRDQKDKPIVVFDTCSHTGGTIENILAVLEEAGFLDVRIITANSPDADSGIIPDAKLDKYTRLRSCYPFGKEEMVVKGTDVTTRRSRDPQATMVSAVMRDEIRRIIATGVK
jgi:hypothetical protein